MATVQVRLPEQLVPVFSGPAMYRGAYGGRGSAKTRSFAKMAAVHGLRCAQANERGVIVCGREFMNSLDESSLAEVKEAVFSEPWLAGQYDVGEKYVRTKDGRVDFAFVGLRHNLDSIKSKARIRLLWVDEAEPVSETAWHKADNTVREDGAEVWVTWNPERKNSATHNRFRLDPPAQSKIIRLNWRDNPWFPPTLNQKRLNDLQKRPDQYDHIWEGDFVTAIEGAYYAGSLSEARSKRRIGRVERDPVMSIRAFWDIGLRDATAIWVAQFIGKEIRVLAYYEAVGQPLATHLAWLRDNGFNKCECVLPHDAAEGSLITATRYEDHVKAAGFPVTTVPNQGKGAAMKRVEAGRRVFPSIWFNESACQAGLDALGWYHEKKSDDERAVGLGPNHDWCLAAGTQVLTPGGWRAVQDIAAHDDVVTPCGVRRVLRSGVVRMTSEWTTVRGIRCTPEHRFFTSRGLVEAGALLPEEKYWTRGDLGLSILACLSAALCFGLKAAITSATQEESRSAVQCSYTEWFMRLCTAAYRTGTRSIISMMTRSTTTPTILRPSCALNAGVFTNQRLALSVPAVSAGKNSDVIRNSERGAAKNASAPITHESSASAVPAYNLTVAVDECYFVRGHDGLAYLVSNSSHGADAFGLMCIAYEEPTKNPASDLLKAYGHSGRTGGWQAA